jgi:hypothetical protein
MVFNKNSRVGLRKKESGRRGSVYILDLKANKG